MPQATISRPLKRNRTKTPKMSWGFKNHFDGLCAFDRQFKFHIILAAGDDAAIIIAQYGHGLADQIRPEYPLTGNVKIVAIDECEQRLHYTG